MFILKQIVKGQLYSVCCVKLGFLHFHLNGGREDTCSDSLILPCFSGVLSFPTICRPHVSVFIGRSCVLAYGSASPAPCFLLGWSPARPELPEPSCTQRFFLSWWCSSSSCLLRWLPWLVDRIQSGEAEKSLLLMLSCDTLFHHPSEDGLKLWCGTDFWDVPHGSFIDAVFRVRLCSRLTWFKCRWLL